MKKRKLEVVVISDVHLGTYDCHAEELLAYLSSINPDTLVLNGDIIDFWPSGKKHFPPAHLGVIKKIIAMASGGTRVFYVTGNHDDMVRKFVGTSLGNFSIHNKLLLELDGKKAWIFHGDVFDLSVQHAKWFAKLGRYGYMFLMWINRGMNRILKMFHREKYSLARRIRTGRTKAAKFIASFERSASDLAIENQYDFVICGHIHHPNKRVYENSIGNCTYLNAGDWTEHLTALEYSFKRWKLYHYCHDKLSPFFADEELKEMDIHEIMASLIDLRPEKAGKKDRESIDE